MSTLYLSEKHISTVACYITRVLNAGFNRSQLNIKPGLVEYFRFAKDKWGYYKEQAVFEHLEKLNGKAYRDTYARHPECMENICDREFCPDGTDYFIEFTKEGLKVTENQYKMVKLLAAYIYNIDDEECMRVIDGLVVSILSQIVTTSRQYEDAAWTI